MRLGFATHNANKLREAKAILADLGFSGTLEAVSLDPEPEETGLTFEENAQIKLQAILQPPWTDDFDVLFAEDAGLVIPALAGHYGLDPFPGVQSKRWLTPERSAQLLGHPLTDATGFSQHNAAILKLMDNQSNRQAAYIAAVAFWQKSTNQVSVVTGTMALTVAQKPAGTEGFGYDPITIAHEVDSARTVAELSMAVKNQASHRANALKSLLQAF